MACWKWLLVREMAEWGEGLWDVVAGTFQGREMEAEFEVGRGPAFTVWTERSVYFPVCGDGVEWVGRVARHPDGVPTQPHGTG
jgi:hypothetical protein